MIVTPRLEHAIRVAATAHQKQFRKGEGPPYIIHPFSVMCIASGVTDDEDVLIACLFHDILEDVPKDYPESSMRADFGDRVVEIVLGVTNDGSIDNWQQRSEAYLSHLKYESSDESVIVSCADKIHNLMSTVRDYRDLGDEVWQRFGSGKDEQLWWYKEVLKITSSRLPDLSLNQTLAGLIREFEDFDKSRQNVSQLAGEPLS